MPGLDRSLNRSITEAPMASTRPTTTRTFFTLHSLSPLRTSRRASRFPRLSRSLRPRCTTTPRIPRARPHAARAKCTCVLYRPAPPPRLASPCLVLSRPLLSSSLLAHSHVPCILPHPPLFSRLVPKENQSPVLRVHPRSAAGLVACLSLEWKRVGRWGWGGRW